MSQPEPLQEANHQTHKKKEESKRGKEFPVTFHIRHDYLVQMFKGRIIEQIFDHLF